MFEIAAYTWHGRKKNLFIQKGNEVEIKCKVSRVFCTESLPWPRILGWFEVSWSSKQLQAFVISAGIFPRGKKGAK